MKPQQQGAIYEVQLTNEQLFAKLLDSKVNDYVSLGKLEDNEVSGRLCYRSADMIHVKLVMFYAMVNIKTKTAFFVDLRHSNPNFNAETNLVDQILNESKTFGDPDELVTSLT